MVAGTLSDTATSVGIVLRLTPNGTPDPTFGTNGHIAFTLPVADSFRQVAIDSAGRILVAASNSLRVFETDGSASTAYSNYATFGTSRLLTHADGTVTLFQNGGTTYLTRVAPDNTVIATGTFDGNITGPVLEDGPDGYTIPVYQPNRYGILRIGPHGEGRTDFGGGPTAPAGFLPGDAFGFPFSFSLAGDGSGGFVVLGPDADNANQMAVAHLTSTGALDTSLGNGGRVSLPGLGNNIGAVAVVPRGILAAITGLDAVTAQVVQLAASDTQAPTVVDLHAGRRLGLLSRAGRQRGLHL